MLFSKKNYPEWVSLVAGPDGLWGARITHAGEGWTVSASGTWTLPAADAPAEGEGAAGAESALVPAGEAPADSDAAAAEAEREALEDGRWAETLRKAASELGGGPVALALPTSQLLVKVLDLPKETSGDLPGIVQLQMDELSPFAGEELTTGHETLAETEDRLRVFAAGLPQPAAERWDARLKAAGIRARRVDAAILGAWWSLSAAGVLGEGDGRRAILLERAGEWDLLLLEGGAPILCRSLGSGKTAEDLALDLTLSLLSAELKGAVKPLEEIVAVTAAPPDPAMLDALSRAAGGVPARTVGMADSGAPAPGCARRAAGSAPLDLLPASWRTRELSAVAKRRYIAGMAAAGVLWILLLAGLLLAPKISKRFEDAERRAVERDKPAYYAVRDVRDRVRLIRSYMDRSRSMLECLRTVVEVMPPGMTLTGLTYRREEGIRIAAEVTEVPQAYAFKEGISDCGLFDNCTLGQLTRNAAKKVERFEVDARFDPKPEKEGGRR